MTGYNAPHEEQNEVDKSAKVLNSYTLSVDDTVEKLLSDIDEHSSL